MRFSYFVILLFSYPLASASCSVQLFCFSFAFNGTEWWVDPFIVAILSMLVLFFARTLYTRCVRLYYYEFCEKECLFYAMPLIPIDWSMCSKPCAHASNVVLKNVSMINFYQILNLAYGFCVAKKRGRNLYAQF